MAFISKSRYLEGLQCRKLLWYRYNAAEEIPAYDESTLAIFDQGHQVGALAKTLYAGGVEIGGDHADYEGILRRSAEALKLRKPLFEPAFRSGNAFARADILSPAGRTGWDVIEVKSSTEVKDVHVADLALQSYAYRGAGLEIRRCILMHIDNTYERRGPVEPEKLFAAEDVTAQVRKLEPGVGDTIRSMLGDIRRKDHPPVPIGPWCSDPYVCPLMEHCWSFLPEHTVLDLPRIGGKGYDLLKKGIADIADLPPGLTLSRLQKTQADAVRTGRAHVDRESLRAFLAKLEYPLYFLDFESFAAAVPPYDLSRPYEQIPFQFSLHTVEREGAPPVHAGFVAGGKTDPRPEILERLAPLLGSKGSVVSYNAAFEMARIGEASNRFRRFAPFSESLRDRFVDLLAPFRSYHYYHPDQKGSASMKAVLPALTGESYEGLEIAEGGAASREYMRVTFGDVSEEERRLTRERLEKYCALDTSGMISIIKALKKLAG